MSGSIKLSEKYGVNPAIPKCFYCGEDKNEIILVGKLPGDVEAPRGKVWDKEPCVKCAEYMQQGIILISVDVARTTDKANPWRSGGWVVMREEAVRRLFTGDVVEQVCKSRVCFVPNEAWDMLGLERPSTEKEVTGGRETPDPS